MYNLRNKSVLVTGGSGFIGSHLTERLVHEGASVHVITRSESSDNLKFVKDKIFLHVADICDREHITKLIREIKPKKIYHLAASLKRDRDPKIIDHVMNINFHGTLNLLDAVKASDLESFVFTSTSDVYGSNKSPFYEEQQIDPINPYSLSKAAAELTCKMYFKTFGVPIVILRPFLTYGPRQKPNLLIPEIIMSALKKKEFRMTKGEQQRDINFIDDLVEALIKSSVSKEAIGETLNIGSGNKYKIVDIVETILDIMGNPIEPNVGALPYRENEVWEMYCDNTKAKKVLGWEPKTNLTDGLKKTIKWYEENYISTKYD